MPQRDIGTPSRRGGSLESSNIDDENPVVENSTAASPPRAKDKECQDSEGENPSVTDGADEDYQEDNPSSKKPIILNNPRVLRSAATKQEPTQLGSPTLSQTETPNLRKRGHEKNEDEAIRPGKRGRKSAVRAEEKHFETTIQELLEDYKSKARGLETFKTKNQRLRLQISSLKKDLKEAQQAQQDLEELEESQSSKVDQLENECSSLRRKLEKAIDDAKQDSVRYIKLSDSEITDEWGKLSFNIRDLVSQCLTKSPINECDGIEILLNLLERQLPLLYCDVASLRTAVLRRTIWDTIFFGVFQGKRPIWHGKTGQMVTQIVSTKGQKFRNNPHCLEMISRMKFGAINDLTEGPQFDEITQEAIDDMIDAAESILSQYIPSSEVECFQNTMEKLLLSARNLHEMMMKSKAVFLLQWLGDDDGENFELYDSKSMESMQSDIDAHTFQYYVEFVEAPALVKYGNADGEAFEFNTILCKSSVILREREVIPTSSDEPIAGTTSHDKASNASGNDAAELISELEQ